MDFNAEANAFTDWLETNPLEASAQTLWFHLMMIANKSGWPEWFAVANPLLQAKVGVTENTLIKHRNTLIQKGRIEYKSQGKKQAGKYRIIPFTSNIAVIREVNREVNREVIREVNREVKGAALNYLNNNTTATNNTTANTCANEPQTLMEAYALVFGGGTMPPVFSKFLVPIVEKYGEQYAIELILETGEAAKNPSLRYIQATHEAWQANGITSRREAAEHKKREKVNGHAKPRASPPRGRGEYDWLSM